MDGGKSFFSNIKALKTESDEAFLIPQGCSRDGLEKRLERAGLHTAENTQGGDEDLVGIRRKTL